MVYRPFGTLDNPTKALAAGGTPAYQSFPLTYKGRGTAADWIGWYAGETPAYQSALHLALTAGETPAYQSACTVASLNPLNGCKKYHKRHITIKKMLFHMAFYQKMLNLQRIMYIGNN